MALRKRRNAAEGALKSPRMRRSPRGRGKRRRGRLFREFTLEREGNKIVYFLDIKITRLDSGLLNFSIFWKPTDMDKYLHFNSYHSIEHKNSLIRSLINRANVICDPQHVNEEISYVNIISKLNGYNNNIIDEISNQIEHPPINPFMPTGAFNICCPRDCLSRHKGGTRGAPLMPREAVSRTANVESTVRH